MARGLPTVTVLPSVFAKIGCGRGRVACAVQAARLSGTGANSAQRQERSDRLSTDLYGGLIIIMTIHFAASLNCAKSSYPKLVRADSE